MAALAELPVAPDLEVAKLHLIEWCMVQNKAGRGIQATAALRKVLARDASPLSQRADRPVRVSVVLIS